MKTIIISEKYGRALKKLLTLKKKIIIFLCVMENDDLVTDPTDVSNSFNKYYSNVAENILNKRDFVGDGNFMKYMSDPLPNSIFFEKVDAD